MEWKLNKGTKINLASLVAGVIAGIVVTLFVKYLKATI